jgi:hypothetical protein
LDFFPISFDNIDMASKFWDNVRNRLNVFGKTQKWLANESKVGKTVINSGISRLSSPTVDNAYSISKVLNTTIEELVDGEAGAEYVRGIVRNDPKAIQVPDRLSSIVKDLLFLDEKELIGIRANVEALANIKRGKAATTDDFAG